jgi:type IV pilus assembly protein PilW
VSNVWSPDPTVDVYNEDIKKLQSLAQPPKADSDVINVQFGSIENALLTQDMATTSSDISIDAGLDGVTQGSFLIIGNCAFADLFRVSNVPGVGAPMLLKHDMGTFNQKAELINLYQSASAQVRRFHSDTYYVAQTNRRDAMGNPISALMRFNVYGVPEELAENIEMMKILYGQQSADGSLQYVPASNAVNMRKITQIQITITTKTIKSAEGTGNSYLTKTYLRTIKLRNRS